jgi:hypothetical protein
MRPAVILGKIDKRQFFLFLVHANSSRIEPAVRSVLDVPDAIESISRPEATM